MSNQVCLIVGAGHAAAQLVVSLRQEGWEGRIVLIGEEPYLPYHRPPLSKTFLAGDQSVDDILIRHADSYAKAGVETMTGTRVRAIEREHKRVVLETGERIPYDKLVLAVGSRERTVDLSGSDLPGVCYLRTIADARQIHDHASPGGTAVIVGGGYIGLETAAMLRRLGMAVTVLEMAPRVLNRVTSPEVSAFFTRVHREEGVAVVPGTTVESFRGGTAVREVACSDGSTYPADLVILGIGILPNTALAQEAGLDTDDGILVDAQLRTSDPDILAAGDCTRFYHPLYEARMRLESVQNATDQARAAAATVCGQGKAYNALPWFWSDQYDLKLQIAGISRGYDEVVSRGDPAAGRKFAAFYLKDNTVIAVDAVNMPQAFMLGKRLIAGRMQPDKERLADEDVPLKALLN